MNVYENSDMIDGLFDEVSLVAGCESGRIDSVWIHGVEVSLISPMSYCTLRQSRGFRHVVMMLNRIFRRISC